MGRELRAGAKNGSHGPLCGSQCVRQPQNRTEDCAGYFPEALHAFSAHFPSRQMRATQSWQGIFGARLHQMLLSNVS
jgi:hypothetical protein